MAGNSTISITFKLESDGKGFKELSKDADGLKKAMVSAVTETGKLNAKFINLAAVSTSIKNAQEAIGGLQQSLQGLADAYYKSEEQSTKLLTVMRQRMTATNQEISSVNQLIGAQTKLGVLGGTVQRAGAQQLATFLKTSTSLRALIPAMNDLVAQQKGLNAETSDAVTVANLMGKAMTGQTTALRRVGIVFTEAQGQVLKYGDEQQRAATLAQVITDNVGHMNSALANTDAGHIKQIKNEFGSLRVKLGEIASKAMPALSAATSMLGVALMALNINASTSSLLLWVRSLSLATLATKAKTIALGALRGAAIVWNTTARFVTGTNTALGVSGYTAAAGLTAAKMALRGLLVATGVGIAIAGLTMAIEYLMNMLDKGNESAQGFSDGLTAAQRVAKQTAETIDNTTGQTYGQLKSKYTELQNAWKRLRTEHEKMAWIRENQSAFKDLGVSVYSVKDAEDVFVNNTAKVEEAFRKRAQAAAYTAVLTELYTKQIEAEQEISRRDRAAQERHKLKTGDVISSGDPRFSALQPPGSGNKYKYVGQDGKWHVTAEGAAVANRFRWYDNSQTQQNNRATLTATNSQIKTAEAEAAKYAPADTTYTPKGSKGGGNGGGGGDKGTPTTEKPLVEIEKPLSEEDYQNNLRYYEEQANGLDMTSDAYADLQKKIRDTQAEYNRLKGANNTLIVDPKSLNDYEHNLTILRDKQREATSPEEYKALQKQIEELTAAEDKFKGAAEEPYKPAAVEEINTLGELDKAIRYYQELQNTQTADEIENTQRVINKLEEKRQAMQRSVQLPEMADEVHSIENLSRREYRIKVKGMGFDELTKKIEDLQAMLDDTKNPVTGKQREEIEGLQDSYKKMRKDAVMTFDTLKDGWSGIKGVGDSISGISQALDSNSNAWQKLTGVIDGFISLAESIMAVINLINMITTAVKGAQGADTATNTAATAAVIAENKAQTASYAQLAAAKIVASSAILPGAGLAIAGTQIAAAAAMIEGMGGLMMASPFAKGGIVSGPTLALVGEYSGAARNPEVIAPLDKLRSMLQPAGAVGGRVEFSIEGRRLVGVLANETRISGKSGHRTNIRI